MQAEYIENSYQESVFTIIIEKCTHRLRRVEETKHRVLLEADCLGHHIVYECVKRVNELVIDGYAYDAVDMLIERCIYEI